MEIERCSVSGSGLLDSRVTTGGRQARCSKKALTHMSQGLLTFRYLRTTPLNVILNRTYDSIYTLWLKRGLLENDAFTLMNYATRLLLIQQQLRL